MTAASILISALVGLGAMLRGWEGFLFPDIFGDWLTIYVGIFLVGLLSATVFAALSRSQSILRGVAVLWLNFIGSHIAWSIGDEHYVLAQVLDAATVAYFVLAGTTRWEWTIGLLFAASVLFGALGMFGLLPEAGSGFITMTFPSIAGILGNIASAILGFGAGDSGRRVRLALRVPVPWARAAA